MIKTVKKIISPVDLYDFHPETAEYALTLASAFDAEIIVLYVLELVPPRYLFEGYASFSEADKKIVRHRVEARMDELVSRSFNTRRDRGEVVIGNVADKIVQVSEEYSADMITMVSHGRSTLGHILYDSVTNKVIANTKIPVLVIPPTKE